MNVEKKRIKDLVEFLIESNAIEQEYGRPAFEAAYKAWQFLDLDQPKKFNFSKLEMLHYILIEPLAPAIAGKFRTGEVSVGAAFVTPSILVREQLLTLLKSVPKTEAEIKIWHVKFERIHPFWDGNGRAGRLIMNWHRVKNNLPILVIHEGEEQMEYYEWFKD